MQFWLILPLVPCVIGGQPTPDCDGADQIVIWVYDTKADFNVAQQKNPNAYCQQVPGRGGK